MAVISLTINNLKANTTPSFEDIYYVTDNGRESAWTCTSVSGNNANEDNTGTVLIGSNGAKYVRIYTGAANVSWFKKDSEADWTQAIQRAVNADSEIYFPEGVYLISGSIYISGNKKLLGNGTITKEKNAQVFFKFFQITGVDTRVHIEDLTFDGNMDPAQSHWRLNDAPGIVVINDSTFIYTDSIREIAINNITCVNLHGSAVNISSARSASVHNCQFRNIEGTQAIVMWGNGELCVTGSTFENIGLLPDSFYVTDVPSNINGAYFHQFGDAISGFNSRVIATGNAFTNICRASMVHDLNKDSNYLESIAIFKGNTILHNSPNLKNSNPPASIWCEKGQTAIVAENKIRYIQRHPMEDNHGYAITFTSTGYSATKSVITGNIINADNFNNRTYGGITVSDVHENSEIIISGNALSGRMTNAILVGGSGMSQAGTAVRISNNVIRIPDMDTEAACIRLEGTNPYMPSCVEISSNTFFSDSDNFITSVPETGKKVITIGYSPNYFKLVVKGNDFNGGTAWLGNLNIDLTFENNTDCALYHMPDFGSPVQISVNRFVKKTDLRGIKGVINGNFFLQPLTLTSCQDLVVAGNEFRVDVNDQLILDVSYQLFGRVIVKHNSFALNQANRTAIHFKKTGTGIYDTIACVGNIFHGPFLDQTYGFVFDAGTTTSSTFLADNRAKGITALEKSTSLNTNI